MTRLLLRTLAIFSLNESPSEKEGKYPVYAFVFERLKGLNESPSEKEGKFPRQFLTPWIT